MTVALYVMAFCLIAFFSAMPARAGEVTMPVNITGPTDLGTTFAESAAQTTLQGSGTLPPGVNFTEQGAQPGYNWSITTFYRSNATQGWSKSAQDASLAGTNGPEAKVSTLFTLPGQYQIKVSLVMTFQPGSGATIYKGTNSVTLSQTVLGKTWTVGTPITGGNTITTNIAGVARTSNDTGANYVSQSTGVPLTMETAADSDHWQLGATAGDEADAVTYAWSSNGGGTFSSTTAPVVTWTSPLLTGEDANKAITLTCVVSDSKTPGVGEDGTRHDADKTRSMTLTVVRKNWLADPVIGKHPLLNAQQQVVLPIATWLDYAGIESPKDVAGAHYKITPGQSLSCVASEAQDWDTWSKGAESESVLDATLVYVWSADKGGFLDYDTEGKLIVDAQNKPILAPTVTGRTATWFAPSDWVKPADGTTGEATLTCTINDGAGARLPDPDANGKIEEIGTHDDAAALVVTAKVDIVPSLWAIKDKEIGFAPQYNTAGAVIGWTPNGRITAPIDQTVAAPAPFKRAYPGQTVDFTVGDAQDWDTFTEAVNGKLVTSIKQDTPLTYTWTAKDGKGDFLIPGPGNTTIKNPSATGLNVKWMAPDDITADTEVEIYCTITDAAGDRVTQFIETGSRKDTDLVRTVLMKVMVPSFSFTYNDATLNANGTVKTPPTAVPTTGARSCAGGVSADGVHDFTLIATARFSDGTLIEGESFNLSFEKNRGHDYSSDDASTWPSEWTTAKALSQTPGQVVPFDPAPLIKRAKFLSNTAVTTDAAGQFTIQVLSSDIVSKDISIAVKRSNANGQGIVVGNQICDFAASVSLRRFGLVNFPNDPDTGWIFNQDVLLGADTTPTKVYLKFQIDPSIPRDIKYFNLDGSPKNGAQMSDRGNWKLVNGHEIKMRIVTNQCCGFG